ncbi:hypothetical protein EVAR_53095_1 [Eumeta japonica]|uniref:Uncharacterized protein n=1 Tax=Eumeta variegata TaxID=151549 RepID=A0A4C1ZK35_EUMVA|nr:hypothetical protein EVAR_53095_1 [Eumeta japonica]
MRSLHTMCGVSRKDKYRNSDVRERCGLKEDVVAIVERVYRLAATWKCIPVQQTSGDECVNTVAQALQCNTREFA